MKYTIEQLMHLRNIRAVGFNESIADDRHDTERGFFEWETKRFIDWIKKMEGNGKIKELLSTIK